MLSGVFQIHDQDCQPIDMSRVRDLQIRQYDNISAFRCATLAQLELDSPHSVEVPSDAGPNLKNLKHRPRKVDWTLASWPKVTSRSRCGCQAFRLWLWRMTVRPRPTHRRDRSNCAEIGKRVRREAQYPAWLLVSLRIMPPFDSPSACGESKTEVQQFCHLRRRTIGLRGGRLSYPTFVDLCSS